jgi:hypothetical protein
MPITGNPAPITIGTYANGFGDWYAETTETGVGDSELAQKLAEVALWHEISQRNKDAARSRFSAELSHRVSKDGTLISTFVESWADDEDGYDPRPTYTTNRDAIEAIAAAIEASGTDVASRDEYNLDQIFAETFTYDETAQVFVQFASEADFWTAVERNAHNR